MASELIELTQIFDGGSTDKTNRWSAWSYFDKVIFANNTANPQYWPGIGICNPIPGLPSSELWDGVCAFKGHILGWYGRTMRWNDINDFATWIPIAESPTQLRLTLSETFNQPEANATTDWIYIDEAPERLATGTFVRVNLDPEYNFYTVADVLPFNSDGQTYSTVGFAQTIAALSSATVYVKSTPNNLPKGRFKFSGSSAKLTISNMSDITAYSHTLAAGFIAPSVNSTITVSLNDRPQAAQINDYITLGESSPTGRDIYQITGVDIVGKSLTIKRLGKGYSQQNSYELGSALVKQPWFLIENLSETSIAVSAANDNIIGLYGLKLTNLGLSGATLPQVPIISGTQIITMPANSAGESVNIDGWINEEIKQIIPFGNVAFIFRERSIQSMTYAGRPSIWAVNPELKEEGLLGKYTVVAVGQQAVYFWGHKGFYSYAGSGGVQPLAMEVSKSILDEIDLGRIDEAWMLHREQDFEIWTCYPVKNQSATPRKVFIYNYLYNTCSFDTYDEATGGLTAAGLWDWTQDIRWVDVQGSWEDQTLDWNEFVGSGKQRLTMLAMDTEGGVSANIYGRVFTRADEAYHSESQTLAFDSGDPAIFKYQDTVQISLQIKVALPGGPYRLYVQSGSKDNYDSTITWSGPDYVEVRGNCNITTKVNSRASGRFIYLKFYSDEKNIEWRLDSFTLMGRLGGSY